MSTLDLSPGARLTSLDVFRGLTIASMVMVNNQTRGAYPELQHASWHGWTFTDMVFPFFLWIVGVAMTLSTARRMDRGESRSGLLMHTLRRAAIIFAIGLFMNGFPSYDLSTLRIPGVLQRIAVCYLIAGVIFLYSSTRGRVLWTVALLAGYWLMMAPGGYEKGTNFGDRVDQMFLLGHMYTPTRDPEGLVSTLPAIATCLFGILTGDFLRTSLGAAEKAAWMFLSGNVLIFLGKAFDYFQPINKNLWTVTYTVLMAGLALVVFASCYWLVDAKGIKRYWTQPFAIFGMNAIAVYVFHGFLGRAARKIVPAGSLDPLFSTQNAALVYSLAHVGICFGFAYLLYRKRWLLKF